MKFVLWGLYAVFAILCILFSLMSDVSPWFTLALALVFVFGPRIWRQT